MPSRFTRKHTTEPNPFEGLTQRPHCAACAHDDATHPQALPPICPEAMPPSNRRPCAIDTARHFCPHAGCDYRGWLGLGHLRANGHPSGGPWRQLSWRSGHGYVLETHGTLLHGKRLSVELIVRVLACLAAGLGIRATARGGEVDPNPGLQWLVEAAERNRSGCQNLRLLSKPRLSYPQAMETHPVLPPESWDQTPPEVQAYIRVLAARVETMASMVCPLQEPVRT